MRCLILLLLLCFPDFSNSEEIRRVTNGNELRKAIGEIPEGGTIIVSEGIYNDVHETIKKRITLRGEGKPVFDGNSKNEILQINASGVIVEGITFRNAGSSSMKDNAAVKISDVSGCIVRNNYFYNNTFAIYLANASECKIESNTIQSSFDKETNSGNGIHLWKCRAIHIIANTVNGHRDGIYLEFIEQSYIEQNICKNNIRYGLHFMFSNDCSYVNNTFLHNNAGVAVMFSRRVEMYNNRFELNWGSSSYGLLLKEIYNSHIHHNKFIGNSTGLYSEGSNNLLIDSNSFLRNGWAVRLMANSMGNTFRGNNFIDNSLNVSTNSIQNFNTFRGNYWSDYTGYDLDKNGIGDVPFRPVKLFAVILEKNPPALILLRSPVIGLLNIAESAFPVLTPETLIDDEPRIREIQL